MGQNQDIKMLLDVERTIVSKIHNAIEDIMRGHNTVSVTSNTFESIKYTLDEKAPFFKNEETE